MTEQHDRCVRERDLSDMRADIKMLKKTVNDNEQELQRVKDKSETMNQLNTTMSVMSLSLEHIIEHNQRQDDRQEKQDVVVAKQNETLVNINQNLNELNKGQNNLNQKVANLEARVNINEEKTKINIVDIQKEKYTRYLRDYAVPFTIGSAFAALLLQLLKIIKG